MVEELIDMIYEDDKSGIWFGGLVLQESVGIGTTLTLNVCARFSYASIV